jgi:hypothetical protein
MTTAMVSRQCQASMHLHCRDEDCGCPVCHNTCEVCGSACRAIHVTSDSEVLADEFRAKKTCSTCYLAISSLIPRVGCASCGGPKGYRDPQDSDNRYLCTPCRQSLGLPCQNRSF